MHIHAGHSHDHHHDESHHHGHHHHVSPTQTNRKAFLWGIGLNILFVAAEVLGGLWTHSLALLSDAGHNAGDVAALVLALLAIIMAERKPTQHFTYGYKKATILISLLNSLLLLGAVALIFYEAIERFFQPQPLAGQTVTIIAALGIVVNGLTAFLFFRDKDDDVNVRGAYLHMAADAVVSFGVVIGGLLISFTQWFWIDAALGVVISIVILWSTWSLLRESLRLALDGAPVGVDIDLIRQKALGIEGVKDIHHVHIWAMSTTSNALTAHIVLAADVTADQAVAIKKDFRHKLEHIRIHHATLELEYAAEDCLCADCP